MLILLIGIGLTLAVTSARLHALDGVSSAQLTQAARHAARAGDAALRQWVRRTEAGHPTLRVFLVDRQGRELLRRSLPVRLQDWVKLNLAQTVALWEGAPAGAGPAVHRAHVPVPDSWWNVPAIESADGGVHFALFLPFDASAYEVLGVPHVLVLLFLCAVCVSGLACWVVARHIIRPVLGVQQGLRSLARGELGARMGPALAARTDELGALAADFDATAQRLQELVSAQEMLLRDVSHELRTPLTRLRLALELARRGGQNMPAQLDRIERECGRLDTLTGQVLRLSRLREPRALAAAPLDLAALVGETVADLAYEAEAAGKAVAWQAPHAPVRVHGAAAELASMLENVLRNALRFTPRGGRVDVALALHPGRVGLSVRDRGPGIAPEHLDQVFAPFFQSDPARSSGHQGAGLGLAIAQRVAQRHAGEIRLANRAGGGLRVEITLPC
ncbi:ATP-binding protein [Pseudorhodoferax soli]|uniref:histidine kinase n=1 Tax=Pseudorhodoferax soli TaxID=545864 RepID=A0A368XIT7_9BURK|nr:ATP-binding protein [Pseudorhodoferax soli]RCW67509.1 two-component system sensor histidine kinase CpxA [Pseudorhodoferax soli]